MLIHGELVQEVPLHRAAGDIGGHVGVADVELVDLGRGSVGTIILITGLQPPPRLPVLGGDIEIVLRGVDRVPGRQNTGGAHDVETRAQVDGDHRKHVQAGELVGVSRSVAVEQETFVDDVTVLVGHDVIGDPVLL